jgi:DNA polymerase III subunit delta
MAKQIKPRLWAKASSMKLRYEQLGTHLAKALAPVYLIDSDELLLQQEAYTLICQQARQQGFTEIVPLDDAQKPNWDKLIATQQSVSLFSQKQLLVMRLADNKIGNSGANALNEYADTCNDDNCLILLLPKLDAASQKSRWFNRLEKLGVSLSIWPVTRDLLPNWISQRLRSAGLSTDQHGIDILVERTEGNLLAAAQEIEKLSLLFEPGKLSAEQIAQAVTDDARFTIFSLIDAALAGQSQRCQQILLQLQYSGEPASLVLWSLCHALRQLCHLSYAQQQGTPLARAMETQRIWRSQQSLWQKALAQHRLPYWQRLLSDAAKIDLLCKGVTTGDPWPALLTLSLALHNAHVIGAKAS